MINGGFSVVAVSDDVLAKEARGLKPIPDDDHVAVQRIPSTSSRAVDGMRPSPGNPWSIRDETLPGYQDEDADKINLGTDCPSCARRHNRETRDTDIFLSQLPVV